jgi:hypothetical protein
MPTYNKVIPSSVIQHFDLTVHSWCESQNQKKTIQHYILKYITIISEYFNYERKNCL